MQDHELKVKHIASGKELIVSKAYYHNAPDEYELVDGEAGDSPDKEVFTPSVPPKLPTKVKAGAAPTKNKSTPVPPPVV